MNDKPVAALVAAIVAVPLVLLCCLGPVVLGSVLGAMAGWLSGLDPGEILGLAAAAAGVAYGLLRWWRAWLQ